jgi:MFS family permease
VATLLLDIAFIGVMFVLPLYLQLIRGRSTLDTGLLIAPLGIGAAATMALTGHIADRVQPRTIILAGMGPFTLGLLGLARIGAGSSLFYVGLCELLIGIGSGATQMQVMTAALKSLPTGDTARANTVLIILMRVGASIGVALVSLVLSDNLAGGTSLTAVPQTAQAAHAFAIAFRWAAGTTIAAIVPVTLLPRGRVGR